VAIRRLQGRLLGWYRDDLINRLIRNLGYLLSGSLVAAGLGLIALALTARALGPAELGLLALIEAYARVIDRFIRLEPWQALIKYGADALEGDRPEDFRSLLKFGVLVDVGGALCSAIVAVTFVAMVGPWLDWSAQTVQMAAVYSASLIFQLSATPIAVLRLFDRFGVFAWLEVATALARVILFAVAFLAGAGLWTLLQARGRPVHLVVIGNGLDERNQELSALVRESGIGAHVSLLGERTDVPALVSGFDIAALCFAWGEGFPNVLGEAMASGVPCVATDIGDCGWVLGPHGILVPPRDSEAMADALGRLIDLGSEGRQQLGLAGRARILQHFSLQEVVRQYEALHRSVSAAHPGRRSGAREAVADVRHHRAA
jgi:glycosyltransferase involved in cell wall biosynthesis